ncbi:uncharacterized protein LOC100878838 isoform X2 [Megachile rotundata]|uniref:uncharacterized protein LOC100878838 isoform X2 n=1 Tax=Megachile rotundata TaxID=143995 RepID=UPI000614C547|nr:PREDICTED: uncharacterized protein LOC100878838 isoform X2 [Megachile rotundata]
MRAYSFFRPSERLRGDKLSRKQIRYNQSNMSRCKCPKSDVDSGPKPRSAYFEDITSKMEERRCDLVGKEKYLRDKITTMERSIPALVAFNMWMAKKCENAPYCKVREIMKRFAPYPDQTEKLLSSLKRTVRELNGETTELHEKIIQADVQLEETDIELESLELANEEMNDTLKNLEKEVRSYETPSLHSIRSEDLICLSKIRQLAEEELNLKNHIKELEQKETLFKEHIDRLAVSKEYQSVCGRRRIDCAQDLECNATKIRCVPRECSTRLPTCLRKKQPRQKLIGKSDVVVSTSDRDINDKREEEIKEEKPAEEIEKKRSWIPNWWNSNHKVQTVSSEAKSAVLSYSENNKFGKNEEETKEENTMNDKPPKQSISKFSTPSCEPCGHSPCPPTTSTKFPRSSYPCVGPRELRSIIKKSCTGNISLCNIQVKSSPKDRYMRKGCCDISSCTVADHGIRKSCIPMIPACDLKNLCEICPSPCKNFLRSGGNNCRCNCKGKCALGLSDTDCNCSDALDPSEEYRPIASKQLDAHVEGNNSEDEYCECCSCGCEDSDASLSCRCN